MDHPSEWRLWGRGFGAPLSQLSCGEVSSKCLLALPVRICLIGLPSNSLCSRHWSHSLGQPISDLENRNLTCNVAAVLAESRENLAGHYREWALRGHSRRLSILVAAKLQKPSKSPKRGTADSTTRTLDHPTSLSPATATRPPSTTICLSLLSFLRYCINTLSSYGIIVVITVVIASQLGNLSEKDLFEFDRAISSPALDTQKHPHATTRAGAGALKYFLTILATFYSICIYPAR